jgi:hypothetical protein
MTVMAGPTWTATKGGLVGGGAGLVGGAAIGYAIGHRSASAPTAPVSTRRHARAHENPAGGVTLGGLLGTAIGGLVGAMLGKRSQYNAWNAANQACAQGQVADWVTFQCVSACPDDTIPVNGQCQGYVPKAGLFGAPKSVGVAAPMGLPQLSPVRR